MDSLQVKKGAPVKTPHGIGQVTDLECELADGNRLWWVAHTDGVDRVLSESALTTLIVPKLHAANWFAEFSSKHSDLPDGMMARAAAKIHYPDCWDTATYPTLVHALWECVAPEFECHTCSEAQAEGAADEAVRYFSRCGSCGWSDFLAIKFRGDDPCPRCKEKGPWHVTCEHGHFAGTCAPCVAKGGSV